MTISEYASYKNLEISMGRSWKILASSPENLECYEQCLMGNTTQNSKSRMLKGMRTAMLRKFQFGARVLLAAGLEAMCVTLSGRKFCLWLLMF